MSVEVVITGLGCVSPVGNTAADTWAALLAGRSGGAPITLFDASAYETRIAAEVKGFDPVALFGRKDARRMDRYTQFALAATNEALADSGLAITDHNRDRIGVYLGSGIGGIATIVAELDVLRGKGPRRVSPFLVPMMLPDSAGGMIAIQHGLRGPNLGLNSACATGNNAIGEAAEVIRRGWADVMIAGAAEAGVVDISVAGFGAMGALTTRNDSPETASRPFDATRDGFLVAEGGAALILESAAHAQARGARIYAKLAGYGITNDAHHVSAPLEDGAGAVACMRMALRQAGLTPADIHYLNAHGTSTPLNDKSETRAIKTVFGEAAARLPISSIKSMTGHLLGAAGAVEAVACVLALRDQIIPPTINYANPDPECDLDYVPNAARPHPMRHILSNSFGFGGHNACLVFSVA